jgi:hypothetical protein
MTRSSAQCAAPDAIVVVVDRFRDELMTLMTPSHDHDGTTEDFAPVIHHPHGRVTFVH